MSDKSCPFCGYANAGRVDSRHYEPWVKPGDHDVCSSYGFGLLNTVIAVYPGYCGDDYIVDDGAGGIWLVRSGMDYEDHVHDVIRLETFDRVWEQLEALSNSIVDAMMRLDRWENNYEL